MVTCQTREVGILARHGNSPPKEPWGIPTAASGDFRAPAVRKSDDTAEKVQPAGEAISSLILRMRRRPFGSLFREVQTFDLPRRWVRTRARRSFNTSPNGNWRARLAHLVIVHCYFPSSHWYACAKPARGSQAARCFGVHCCAAAGKDANVSARPKAAERPVPARRFNLAMEILIIES